MRLRLINAATALLLAAPGISFGLGLGEIQLKSTLNAPLNAEIELFATDEELSSLKAQLASRDTFTRYGLDYPAFLTGVQVRVIRAADGRNALQLTSSATITEPFATFMVEANWARGRIQREYTVLFDPPTFAPQQTAPAAPVAAPTAGGARAAEIARPAAPTSAPASSRPAPAQAAAPATAAGAGGNYKVPHGDSLSSIAKSHYDQPVVEQAMIAIYRSNPNAFAGNINQLRAGAVLRLPDGTEVAAIDRAAAIGEVRRQMTEWAGRPAGAAPDSGTSPRLVLVPPGGAAGTGTATGNTAPPAPAIAPQLAPATAPGNRVQVGDAGFARVQEDASKAAPKPAATPPAAAPVPPATKPGDVSINEVNPPAAVQTEPAATTPPVTEPKPKEEPKKAVAPAPAPAEPTLLERVQEFWFVPAGLIVLLLAVLGLRAARRRRATAADGFAPFAIEPTLADDRDTSADTFPLRKPVEARDTSIVVEESAVPRTVANRKEAPRTVVDLDEGPSSTPSVDGTGSFEQGDPLAEADFHMAYGLYDQAADLVKLAIAREPARRDLKLKLLEVYFVWGNKEQFLVMARDLASTRDAAQPGEWEKVVIMGKQLAPEDPLFTQSYGGVSPSSVDLNLEGGQNLVDFDLPSESSTRLPRLSDEAAGGGAGLGGLDFMLDDPTRGGDGMASNATTQAKPGFAIDGPTVEQPALGLGDTISGKIAAPRAPIGMADQTAELALDDLGLDLGKLEATGSSLLDDSQLTRALSANEQGAETLVAGLDETSRQLLEQAGATQVTELLPLTDLGGDTSRIAALDLNLDSDVDSTASTGKREAPEFNLDLDVGVPEQSVDGEYQRTQRIDQAISEIDSTQRDLEPVSMSEVGTKLDLARAYMDMGDPDGARSILGEVLAEGSPTQRQEAQRLLDSIPG